MSKIKSIFISSLPTIIIAGLIVTSVIYAWKEPTAEPPKDNVDAPINVGEKFQKREGPLELRSGLAVGTALDETQPGLIVKHGKVGIGTTRPEAKLEVVASSSTSTQNIVSFGTPENKDVFSVSNEGSTKINGVNIATETAESKTRWVDNATRCPTGFDETGDKKYYFKAKTCNGYHKGDRCSFHRHNCGDSCTISATKKISKSTPDAPTCAYNQGHSSDDTHNHTYCTHHNCWTSVATCTADLEKTEKLCKKETKMLKIEGLLGIGRTAGSFKEPTRLKVPESTGSVYEDWLDGWGGEIATWDIVGASAYFNQYSRRSDISLKENIHSLSNSRENLKKITELNPVSFYWNGCSKILSKSYSI